MRRVVLCLLPLFGLALWVLALSSIATAGSTATADSPARISVPIPARAKDANLVMLDLRLTVTRKPAAGQLGAVVRARRPGGSMTEVGRVSIMGDDQSYQFNVTSALGSAAGGSADVEVSLIDRGGGSAPTGAALSIGHAEIVTR